MERHIICDVVVLHNGQSSDTVAMPFEKVTNEDVGGRTT